MVSNSRIAMAVLAGLLFLGQPAIADNHLRSALVESARRVLDIPYSYGGRRGLDCSALTQKVYRENGIRLPRTVRRQAKADTGKWVERPRPGDLVFFKNTSGRGLTHVGVYVGDGEMIHAGVKNGVVEQVSLDNPYFQRHLYGYRDYLDDSGRAELAVVKDTGNRRSSLPFWLTATGMVAGTIGGLLAEGAQNKAYFAGGGFLLFGIGVTWGNHRGQRRVSLAGSTTTAMIGNPLLSGFRLDDP